MFLTVVPPGLQGPQGCDLRDDGPTEPTGTAGTAADLSGTFALQWDEKWIYLAAQVTDNVHDIQKGSPREWYFRDAVNLFLAVPRTTMVPTGTGETTSFPSLPIPPIRTTPGGGGTEATAGNRKSRHHQEPGWR